MSARDDWPTMPDGSEFDGEELLSLVRSGNSPFLWDVNLLVREIEENLDAHVIDIPIVDKGSNNYGFHITLSNGLDIVARLARGDVNMPNFSGFPIGMQAPEAKFEAAVYKLLRTEPNTLVSLLLYHRIPVQRVGPKFDPPLDLAGRRLLVFEKAEGEKDTWWELSHDEKDCVLAQTARIRASLFNFNLPLDFAETWLRERLCQRPSERRSTLLQFPIAPTRECCISLFESKIKAIIRNQGDVIGYAGDNFYVGPNTAAAKQSLLRLLPYILPADSDKTSLYRLVLEHGDFGIHNMSITLDASRRPLVTSLYDWETGCILPAILSDPLMRIRHDLVEDENGDPSIAGEVDDETPEDRAEDMRCARVYYKALYEQAPIYKRVIQAGKDARHLWFALQGWRGEDPEIYFGDLGTWAERKMNSRSEWKRISDHFSNDNASCFSCGAIDPPGFKQTPPTNERWLVT